MIYKISSYNKINDKIINEEIFDQEKVNYKIIDRNDQIDHLIDWIGETENDNDKILMKEDLIYIINLTDKYLLSSIQTNEYIQENTKEGQEILKEIFNFKI